MEVKMYTEQQLAKIAKRENNNKRSYLVVNPLQGKHIPVSPTEAVTMFESLAGQISMSYENEKLLLVGFAETATAIGAALAVKLECNYMHTTRENIEGVEYLYFEESHSHAMEQRLVKTDLDKVIDETDRIIFVEDEVTTGNTICKIMDLIDKTYPNKVKFAVASLLNGMNEASLAEYKQRQVPLHYLVKTNHEAYTAAAEKYSADGKYHAADISEYHGNVYDSEISGYMNTRRLNGGRDYGEACGRLSRELISSICPSGGKRILVVGTEECMYPALYVGKCLEELGNVVRSHSTTRSPIAVCSESTYPLHERYELVSLYDEDRKTFIYDIGAYDIVVVVTDAQITKKGRNSLLNALESGGNSEIYMVRWKG